MSLGADTRYTRVYGLDARFVGIRSEMTGRHPLIAGRKCAPDGSSRPGPSPLSEGGRPGPGEPLVPAEFHSVSTPQWLRQPPDEPVELGGKIETPRAPIARRDGSDDDG